MYIYIYRERERENSSNVFRIPQSVLKFGTACYCQINRLVVFISFRCICSNFKNKLLCLIKVVYECGPINAVYGTIIRTRITFKKIPL